VHELFRGSRLSRQHYAFLWEVDFDIELVHRHPVLEVPVEPVSLLDQQHPHSGVGPEVGDHLTEGGATGVFCRFNVQMFLCDRETLRRRILPEQL
jgi:hypothetical protein